MKFRSFTLAACLVFALPGLSGQISREAANRMVEMLVTLSFDDGTPVQTPATGMNSADSAGRKSSAPTGERTRDAATNTQIRVQLQDIAGATVDERSPNAEGKVTFVVRNGSQYRIRVTGPEIAETFVENLQPALGDRLVSIVLHRKDSPKVVKASEATISAKRLQAPQSAKKEIERGADALAQQDYLAARRAFERAIELYPEYDLAYNNLGVVLMQLGDAEGGERAFAKAVELNGSFVRAHINLAKIELIRKDFARADQFLQRALASDPLNAQALFLSAQAQFFSGRLDETLATVKKLHTLPHSEFAMAHFLSGRALHAKRQRAEALLEFQVFLTEDPNDANAAAARELIKELQAAP